MWLSPAGCMMFSLHVRIPFASNLGQRPPYLQHIASLAAVEAVRSQPGYEVMILNSLFIIKFTVKPLLLASPLIRQPQYYGHYILAQTRTPLIPPDFYDPLVTRVTGFQCI